MLIVSAIRFINPSLLPGPSGVYESFIETELQYGMSVLSRLQDLVFRTALTADFWDESLAELYAHESAPAAPPKRVSLPIDDAMAFISASVELQNGASSERICLCATISDLFLALAADVVSGGCHSILSLVLLK
jgi:hypothetical protein